MRFYLSAILFVFSFVAFAQEFSVSGKVVDESKQAISYANIILQTTSNATFVKGTSTDDNGNFVLNAIEPGEYLLKISFIGYKTIEKSIIVSDNLSLQDLKLIEDSEALDQITITAKRPTITRKPDRLIFNVANTALIEGTTLQVLKSTPGIIVSEGSINIKSSPAVIYINNRKVQLTSDELIQLLESAPANSIQSVEVITNPPASFDADSGSVVNIIMSKNLIAGYRGSIATNYTQGVFPRYNAATSHYFKNDKINLNVNYSYTNKKINRSQEDTVNFLDTNNTIDQIWNSDANRNTDSETHNLNFNFDYFINDKTTLSLTSTGLYVPFFNYQIRNNTDIFEANSSFLSRFTSDNLSRDDKLNIGSDINFRHEFKEGSSLSINGHFTTYDYERNQNVLSNFFDINNTFTNTSEFNTLANQDTEIVTGQVDYNVPLSESSTFNAGIKYSSVNTQSDITRLDIINGSEILNTANSNTFDYDENVFAAYANYNKSWKKWDLVLGLRAEQTDIEGFSETLNQTNTQDFLEWFPNFSLSHQITENFSLYGNYKRSITRPNFTNLNPFTFFLNENTVVTGNPNLQPTFKDHFVVGTNFLEHFTIEAYYINYDGAINELPRQDNATNIIAFSPVNLDKTVDFGFDFSFDIYPTEKWNLYFVTSFYNITEEANFGEGFVELDQWANYSQLVNNISFLEDNSLNLSLLLVFGSRNLQGLTIVEDRLVSDLSISKRILKDKGTLFLTVSDLFNEQDFTTSVNYLNQDSRQFTDLDNRFITLGFSYKFGNTKLNENKRDIDAEERERIKDPD
ncbi:TonB-dependent receptor domain-containing protein [Winogradskyella immobilis]|uniref:TonB-dependent receptor domain-containing protein n=1 Tax=Winogradskyella immobilis TaxID=2816852 RepID=UPI001D0CD399|nr:TonB-dependent receptor [Winogradskyella immobilis]MCG0015515.1 TonB-dependent receptor [Winogradskyella immobilis]